jgi:hypothetical protein
MPTANELRVRLKPLLHSTFCQEGSGKCNARKMEWYGLREGGALGGDIPLSPLSLSPRTTVLCTLHAPNTTHQELLERRAAY